ncbi:MAG: TonB-dependent receptor [Pedobacter sp.]|nr:MAG: TonB-dependent receptor [Pedobacter sp.]
MKRSITLIFFVCCLFSFPLLSFAQDLTVIGKVTDKADGKPLPGVTVMIQGTTKGTLTNASGSFTISAPSGAKLVFSMLGMVSQTLDAASTLNVTMENDETSLGEVVVVGYGTQKKSVVTGAISSVKAADLENMPVTRIEQALQGRTAGLTITTASGQPGAGATLRIRGTTTIGNSDALYIVDGVQVDGGIDYLNQSDIESIEVLKDAASASIYGARGGNGVVIVTTKKGKDTGGKLRVNYNGFYGTQAPDHKLDLLNATQYAILYNEAAVAGSKAADPLTAIRFPNPQSLGDGTDWQSEVFNNSAMWHNQELSFQGGTAKSTYFSSFGYLDQEGIVASKNSRYKRFTARFNSSHKITDAITFGNNIGYTRINNVGVATNDEYGSPLVRAINMDPITPAVERDPAKFNAAPYTTFPVVRNSEGFPYGISPYAQSEILNPLAALAVAQGNSWSDKIVGNVFLEVAPIEGLKLRSSGGVDLAFWGDQNFRPVYYLSPTTESKLNAYTRNSNRGLFWNIENTATYTKSIAGHNFQVLAGMSAQKSRGETQGGVKEGLPVNSLSEASLQFPVARTNTDFYGGEYLSTLSSLFGRLTYDYKEKYLLTGVVRRDGSSRFGSNNKYGYFPSASVGWVASKEDFFPENNVVSFLKLRASYGITGNDRIGDFRYLPTVSGGRNFSLGTGVSPVLVNGVSPNALANPDLRWEETAASNIGLDATLFNTLSFTAEVFNKKTTDMLLDVQVPLYVGNNGPVGNVATLTNKGIEFELGYTRNFGEVNFRVNGNATFIKNNIEFLGDDKEFLNGARITPQQLEITRTAVGQAIGSFYGYRSEGIFQNAAEIANYKNAGGTPIQPNAKPGDIRFADLNGDGNISDADREFLGDPTPDMSYGLTVSAAWRGFDILVFGQGVAGNQIFNALRRFDLPSSNFTTAALGRWTGEGSTNSFPRLTTDDSNQNFSRVSKMFIEKGDYFRIKTLQVGYTLPNVLSKKAGLDKVRFYLMSNNLLTFTKYSGYDPEIGGGSYGIDRGYYPQARTYFFGLNLGF